MVLNCNGFSVNNYDDEYNALLTRPNLLWIYSIWGLHRKSVTWRIVCVHLFHFHPFISIASRFPPQIKGRTLRVDHVSNYRPPKDSEDIDDVTKRLREEGCAPKTRFSSGSESEDEGLSPVKKAKKGESSFLFKKKKKRILDGALRCRGFIRAVWSATTDKKEKKKKKKREKKEKKKEAREERRAAQTDRLSPSTPAARVKKEKEDTGYEQYGLKGAQESGGQEARNSRERQEDQQQHGNHRRGERERERDREDERRTGKSRDEARGREAQRPREERERDRGRECERERVRDRVKDRYRERDGENERHHRDGETDKRRDRDSDRRNWNKRIFVIRKILLFSVPTS